MEWLPADRNIALDTLSFVFMANLALNVELVEVELATKHFEFCVVGFKPDVGYPVDAGNVYPLLGF